MRAEQALLYQHRAHGPFRYEMEPSTRATPEQEFAALGRVIADWNVTADGPQLLSVASTK